MKLRIGILSTHPIQYHAPWFRYLANKLDIEVFYAHRQDPKGQAKAGFGVEFNWDIPLLEGYPYRFLKNVSLRPKVGSFYGCDTPELYKIIKNGNFDAFIIFGWNYKSAIQAIRACWQNNILVFMRGDSHLRTKRSRIKSMAKYLPYRWFLPRIDGHLYVGKRNKEYLQYYGVPETKLFFVPHFVNNEFFAKNAKTAIEKGLSIKTRKELNIPPDAFVVLFVGKLIPKKRPEDLILAFLRILAARKKNIHLLFVGEGPLRKKLEGLSYKKTKQIHFVGFKNQSELPIFYATSNVLVLPSDGRETWGLTVNEAMASGIPAIVSDTVGCAPDLIEEGKTGYTYPVGNIEALSDRIMLIEHAYKRHKEKIIESVAKKISCYSMEKATELLEKTLYSFYN